jgi:hypothetical protein
VADLEWDGSDLLKLASDIEGGSHKVAEGAFRLVKDHAEKLRDDWKSTARSSAKKHGKLYPRAITAEQVGFANGPEWEVGPESALPQGGMGKGFEYGSVNQPPHLDMGQAVTKIEPQFYAAVEKLAGQLLE